MHIGWRPQIAEIAQMNESDPHIENNLLNSLKAFLGSHFLLNVINSIQSDIIIKDHKSGFDSIQLFNRVYKLAIRSSNQQYTDLNTELEFLESYAALEHMRYPKHRIKIHTDSSLDPNIEIPSFVVQSLLESVWLSGLERDKNTDLSITVQDNQILFSFSGPTGTFKIHPKVEAKTRLALDRLAMMNEDTELDNSIIQSDDTYLKVLLKPCS